MLLLVEIWFTIRWWNLSRLRITTFGGISWHCCYWTCVKCHRKIRPVHDCFNLFGLFRCVNICSIFSSLFHNRWRHGSRCWCWDLTDEASSMLYLWGLNRWTSWCDRVALVLFHLVETVWCLVELHVVLNWRRCPFLSSLLWCHLIVQLYLCADSCGWE